MLENVQGGLLAHHCRQKHISRREDSKTKKSYDEMKGSTELCPQNGNSESMKVKSYI
jgi:hypothetical protein